MAGSDTTFDNKALSGRPDVNVALRAAGLGVWEIDPLTKQVWWDDRCRELFGLAKDNLLSYEQVTQCIHPEDVDRVNREVTRAMNPQSDGNYNLTYRTIGADDGLLRWVRCSGQSNFNEDGEVIRFAGVAQEMSQQEASQFQQAARDVDRLQTQLKEASSQLIQRQTQLELLSDAVPAMIFYLDLEQRYQSYNQTFMRWFGANATKIIGQTVREFIGEEAYQRVLPYLEIAYSGQAVTYEVKAPSKLGEDRWLNTVYTPHKSREGNLLGIIVLSTDITSSKQTEMALRQNEARFRALIEEAPVATCLFVGREMTIEVANRTMLTYWGKDRSVLGKPLAQAVPELKGQPFLAILDEVFTTGKPYEARNARAELAIDGVLGTYYFDFTYTPLRNAAGEIYGVMDSAVDVTPAVVARQALQESEWYARNLFDNSPIAKAVFVGESMVIRTVNMKMLDLWGRDASIIGQPFMEALPELRPTPLLDRLRQVLVTGETHYQTEEYFELMRYGQPYGGYYEYTYKALRKMNGEIYGVICATVEVTQQVLAHQRLQENEARYRLLSEELEQRVQWRTEELAAAVQALETNNQELAANNVEYAAINQELAEANSLLIRSNNNLQTFAYVASHDLQEPLRKIQQFGDLLKIRHGAFNSEDLTYIERMQSAAERMSTLIRDLLNFSRISTHRDASGSVSLEEVVQQVLYTLELTIHEKRGRVSVGALPAVMGDASQLNQLFQNLLGNALKFTHPGVPPLIEVKANWLSADHLPEGIKPGRAAIAYHRIDVSDNGVGFDEKYLDRIFQVFQRLHGKSAFPGTGIGLAICEKVVANHGGAITASSRPGQGATFSVYLPV